MTIAFSQSTRSETNEAGPLTPNTCRAALEGRIADLSPQPDAYEGRGVVVCAGGPKYFPCAWVCVNMLRRHGCALPVQFWHLGRGECTDEMRRLTDPLGVEWIDGLECKQRFPVRRLGGWELKPYAILHSPFREVMLLDADNVPVRNPEYLFDTPEFRQTGAIFWPDFGRLPQHSPIWEFTGMPFRDEQEIESGQVFIDKARRWRELELTVWFNEHGHDFWYHYVLGDKETFHLAWRKLGTEYSMPNKAVHHLGGHTMCQHDFQGQRVFQHRNLDKWRIDGRNRSNRDFLYENECKKLLEDLRGRMRPPLVEPRVRRTRQAPPARRAGVPSQAVASLAGLWRYERLGHDARFMELLPDGSVGLGAARCETKWTVDAGGKILTLLGPGPTCRLRFDARDGRWRGRWLRFERMPVVMTPFRVASAADKHDFVDAWDNDLYGLSALGVVAAAVFDVGAGIGAFASRAAELWRDASIVAWEPRSIVDALRQNLERYPNARLLSQSVAEQELEALLASSPDLVRIDLEATLPPWLDRVVDRAKAVMIRAASEEQALSGAARVAPSHNVSSQRRGNSAVVTVERGV